MDKTELIPYDQFVFSESHSLDRAILDVNDILARLRVDISHDPVLDKIVWNIDNQIECLPDNVKEQYYPGATKHPTTPEYVKYRYENYIRQMLYDKRYALISLGIPNQEEGQDELTLKNFDERFDTYYSEIVEKDDKYYKFLLECLAVATCYSNKSKYARVYERYGYVLFAPRVYTVDLIPAWIAARINELIDGNSIIQPSDFKVFEYHMVPNKEQCYVQISPKDTVHDDYASPETEEHLCSSMWIHCNLHDVLMFTDACKCLYHWDEFKDFTYQELAIFEWILEDYITSYPFLMGVPSLLDDSLLDELAAIRKIKDALYPYKEEE